MAEKLDRSRVVLEIDLGIYLDCKDVIDKHFEEYFTWLKESCEQLENNANNGFAEPRLKTPRPKKRRLSGGKPSVSTSKQPTRKSKRIKVRNSVLSPRQSSVVKAARKRRTRATECVNVSVADGPSGVPNRAVTRALRRTLAQAGEESKENLSPKVMLEKLSEEDLKKSVARRSLFAQSELQGVPNAESAVDNHVKHIDVQLPKIRIEGPGSETEWTTDEETFYDAKDEDDKPVRKSSSEVVAVEPAAKKKIPVPQKNLNGSTTPLTTRVTRAVTRKQSNTFVTPKNTTGRSLIAKHSARSMVTRTMVRNFRSSTESNTSLDSDAKSSAAGKYTPSGNRVKAPGSALKNLTQSAAKRREELQRKRREVLAENMRKEKEARERKERLLQQKMVEHKQKQIQRENRAAELRAQQLKAKEEQRRLQQVKKDEEMERRRKEREVQKKAELEQRQKAISMKQLEAEQRKLQETKERAEAQRRKREEMERERRQVEREKQENDKLNAIIQQHNSSLQQKALANSYLKKTAAKEATSPKKWEVLEPQKSVLDGASSSHHLEKTFTMNNTGPKSKEEFANYEITPPPKSIKKPPNPANYDISTVQSDDDTDDENEPQKPIPAWAKGTHFIQALANQFGKPASVRELEMARNFPPVKLPVDLDTIFRGHCPVSSKYSKRTSSAVWDIAPQF